MSASVFAAEADAEQAGRLEAALKAAGASVELRASPQPLRGVPVPDGLGPGVEVLSVFVGSRIDGELLAACPDLRGRVLGLVGTGHIGIHVAKIGRGFGMEVLAADPLPQPLLAEVIGFRYLPLEEMVAQADIISLHAPYTPATHHLVDRRLLVRFKPGALLVNTARGGLVDTEALLWALDEGILRGAGLDVLEGEELLTEDRRLLALERDQDALRRLVENQLLAGREDVVVTPHIGFDSVEAVQRIVDVTAHNVAAFLAGRPENLVTPPS
jgi:D-lactate dehydrogenase